MRTTVTLDNDVAKQVTELAHRERQSFKATLNMLLKKGLAAAAKPAPRASQFKVVPHASTLRPGVDPERLNQLADDLEVSEKLGAQPR